MRRWIIVGIAAAGVSLGGAQGWVAEGAEHGGQEHGGAAHEHGGAAAPSGVAGAVVAPSAAEPSAEEIRRLIQTYVQQESQADSAFSIPDEVTGATRRLEFVRVHERVGKTGPLYYSCTDMRDTRTGELLDLDFDVDLSSGAPQVVDARIHKVNGEPRYTYDDHDRRIPVSPSAP